MRLFANAGLKIRTINTFAAKIFSNIGFPFSDHQWRKCVGDTFFEKLLQESVRIAFVSKALKTNQLKLIVVDTTVQPKVVAFPMDVGLMRKAITSLVNLARKNNVDLRQTYERVVKRAAIKSGRYRHAKQMKRARREDQFIRTRLGRVIRDISRKIQGNDALKGMILPDKMDTFIFTLNVAHILSAINNQVPSVI